MVRLRKVVLPHWRKHFDGFKIPFWICIREHELGMLRVFKREFEL